MRYTGPTRKVLNKEADQIAIAVGRKMLGQLRARLGDKIPTAIWHRTMPDGTIITAYTSYGQHSVTVSSEKPTVATSAGQKTPVRWFAEGLIVTPYPEDEPQGYGLPFYDASGNPINPITEWVGNPAVEVKTPKGTVGGPIRDRLINKFAYNGYPDSPDQPVSGTAVWNPVFANPVSYNFDWYDRAGMTKDEWFVHMPEFAVGDTPLRIIEATNVFRDEKNIQRFYPSFRGYEWLYSYVTLYTQSVLYDPDDKSQPRIAHQYSGFPEDRRNYYNRAWRAGRETWTNPGEIIALSTLVEKPEDWAALWRTSPGHYTSMMLDYTQYLSSWTHPRSELIRSTLADLANGDNPTYKGYRRNDYINVADAGIGVSYAGEPIAAQQFEATNKWIQRGNLYWNGVAGTVSWEGVYGSRHHLYSLQPSAEHPGLDVDTSVGLGNSGAELFTWRDLIAERDFTTAYARPFFFYRGYTVAIPEELIVTFSSLYPGAPPSSEAFILDYQKMLPWVVIGACVLDQDVTRDFDENPKTPLTTRKVKVAKAVYMNVNSGELRLYVGEVYRFEKAERKATLDTPDHRTQAPWLPTFFLQPNDVSDYALYQDQYEKFKSQRILGVSAVTFNPQGTEGVFTVHKVKNNVPLQLLIREDGHHDETGQFIPPNTKTITSTDWLVHTAPPMGSSIEFWKVSETGFTLIKEEAPKVTVTLGEESPCPRWTGNYLSHKYEYQGRFDVFVDYDEQGNLIYGTADVTFESRAWIQIEKVFGPSIPPNPLPPLPEGARWIFDWVSGHTPPLYNGYYLYGEPGENGYISGFFTDYTFFGDMVFPWGTIPYARTSKLQMGSPSENYFVNFDFIDLKHKERTVYTKVPWSTRTLDHTNAADNKIMKDSGPYDYRYERQYYDAHTYLGDEIILTHTNKSGIRYISRWDLFEGSLISQRVPIISTLGSGNKRFYLQRNWRYNVDPSLVPGVDAAMPTQCLLGAEEETVATTRGRAALYTQDFAEYSILGNPLYEGDFTPGNHLPLPPVSGIRFSDPDFFVEDNFRAVQLPPAEDFHFGMCPSACATHQTGSVNNAFLRFYKPFMHLGPSMISSTFRDPRHFVARIASATGTGYVQDAEYKVTYKDKTGKEQTINEWVLAGWVADPWLLMKPDAENPAPSYTYKEKWSALTTVIKWKDYVGTEGPYTLDKCFWRSSLDLEALLKMGPLKSILPIGVA